MNVSKNTTAEDKFPTLSFHANNDLHGYMLIKTRALNVEMRNVCLFTGGKKNKGERKFIMLPRISVLKQNRA
jgi:hypothetical protein